MGKYREQLCSLREQRQQMQSIHDQNLSMYGCLMNDKYKRLNEQQYSIGLASIDRRIAAAERLADQERSQEIADGALEALAKDGSKAAKAIAEDLQKALQSIRI